MKGVSEVLTIRNGLILAGLLLIGVTVFLLLWVPSNEGEPLDGKVIQVEIDESLLNSADATPFDHEYQKALKFILDRITVNDAFLEFSLDAEDEEMRETVADRRKNFFDTFYAAVKMQDMDLFLSTVSSDSIAEVWGDELDFIKRIDNLQRVLTNLNREGRLEALQYEFKQGDGYQPANEGLMHLVYSDEKRITIPFQLNGTTVEQYHAGAHNHDGYKLATSLLEIETKIKKINKNRFDL